MNQFHIFSIDGKANQIVSSYIPLLSFSNQESCNIAESYISEEAALFFSDILQIDEPIQMIPYSKTISYKDFNGVPIEYFYNNLFFDLGERDSNKKLIKKLKWGITFDEELTPIQVAYLRPAFSGNSNETQLSYLDRRDGRPRPLYRTHNPYAYRSYGFISINGEPIFYYLHFTLQEILDVIKTAN
jgi:hypothetical protein